MAGEQLIGESGSYREGPEVYAKGVVKLRGEAEMSPGVIRQLDQELLLKPLPEVPPGRRGDEPEAANRCKLQPGGQAIEPGRVDSARKCSAKIRV